MSPPDKLLIIIFLIFRFGAKTEEQSFEDKENKENQCSMDSPAVHTVVTTPQAAHGCHLTWVPWFHFPYYPVPHTDLLSIRPSLSSLRGVYATERSVTKTTFACTEIWSEPNTTLNRNTDVFEATHVEKEVMWIWLISWWFWSGDASVELFRGVWS